MECLGGRRLSLRLGGGRHALDACHARLGAGWIEDQARQLIGPYDCRQLFQGAAQDRLGIQAAHQGCAEAVEQGQVGVALGQFAPARIALRQQTQVVDGHRDWRRDCVQDEFVARSEVSRLIVVFNRQRADDLVA